MTKKIAVVTGGNRGLGFETSKLLAEKGFLVLLTSRDSALGEKAAKKLGDNVIYHQLDVTDEDDINNLAHFIKKTYGKLHVLVNNAGIFLKNNSKTNITKTDIEIIKDSMETNVYGPISLMQALIPLIDKDGRIVNVSSGMGCLSEMEGGHHGYRISKTALNAATKIFSQEVKNGIKINAVCPGWCKTRMGGRSATRSAEKGAEGIVWLATLPKSGPTGGFFRDKKRIKW